MDKYNWKEYKLTEDGQFACRYCNGTKEMGLPIGSTNMVKCWMCEGSGYMIDVIMAELKHAIERHDGTRQELNDLKAWVKQTSKCSLCHGDSNKTIGGSKCKECTLEGTQPWGG